MKILMLNHNVAWRGGTFYRALHAGSHLVQRGHTVTLLSIAQKARWGFRTETRQGVQIVYTPDLLWGIGRTGWDPWDVLNRIVYLRGQSWNIVHAWDSRPVVVLPALLARFQSRHIRGKLVMDWGDWWGRGGTQAERSGTVSKFFYSGVETYFEENFRRYADGHTVISKALFERAIRLGLPSENIRILPQGCVNEGAVGCSRAEARNRLALSANGPLVLSVGALTRSESQLLFESVRALLKRRTDCMFAMIGNHCVEVPNDLRKERRFVETGFVSEPMLADYMVGCDALLVPLSNTISDRARWPSKVNPFLAMGRTVVMTRVGDLAEMLEHEGAALIAQCDPGDLADKLIQLFDSPALRERCETRAKWVADNLLDWKKIVKSLEELYISVASEP